MIQGLKRLVVPKTADQALHPYFLHKERTRYSPAVGGARNDQIDGGDGDDMIGGGAGSDYIRSSPALVVLQRLRPTDSWSPLGGEEVKVSSATWGVYISEEAGCGTATIWQGIGSVPGSSEGDSVDGGAGKGDIIGSGGNDRVQGGDGDDHTLDDTPAETPEPPPPDNIFNGDFLVKTEKNTGAPITRLNTAGLPVEVVATNTLYYVRDGKGNLVAGSEGPTYKNIYDEDGNIVGVEEIPSDDETVTDNTIYATAGRDIINGLTGKDLLSGGAGDDMIGGGAGSDTILGGDGNDFISSSADIQTGRQAWGLKDRWSQWGLPESKTPEAYGATWGVYVDKLPDDSDVTIWSGIANTRTDTASTEADTIDAGAGDDRVIASWADDKIKGGDGDDKIDGLAGNDIIEGGDGDDNISADGIIKEGYLNSVAAVNHGSDFVDGGEGKDNLNGGGKDDQLFGGAGDDFLVGDSTGKTDGEYYVELQYHGQDYLDGEDGDDYLEGGGKEDTLYGGMGDDSLWGDTGADNIVNESDNALMWANDYLDGEDGDDQLVGGGKDDTLYGGIGDDKLFGDEQNIALKAEFQGQDYLDGEDGDKFTIKSIAAGARKPGATCRFHCENRLQNTRNQPARCRLSRSPPQNAYARSARHGVDKGLGRRVDGTLIKTLQLISTKEKAHA